MHMAIRFEVCSGEEPTPMTRLVRRLMMPLALLVPDCNPIYSKGSVCTRQTTKFRTAMASMDAEQWRSYPNFVSDSFSWQPYKITLLQSEPDKPVLDLAAVAFAFPDAMTRRSAKSDN